jgi:hypothetical protein
MGNASQGALAKMGMGAASPVTEAYEFISENLKRKIKRIYNDGIRGTRSRSKERVADGEIEIAGQITMNPSPAELANLLPRILGAAAVTTTYALAETLPEFYINIDRVAKVFEYAGCKVAKATFSGSRGQPVKLALDIIGKTCTPGDAGTFPALTIDTDVAYVFYQGVLTAEGSAREFDQFQLVIDNMLDKRVMNSQTATSITAQDRLITLACSTPYTSDEIDLLDNAFTSAAGAAGSLVFTNGTESTTFTFANLKDDVEDPEVQGKKEILLPHSFTAYKSGTTKELVVTHDSTP